jgi:hypothetical protein
MQQGNFTASSPFDSNSLVLLTASQIQKGKQVEPHQSPRNLFINKIEDKLTGTIAVGYIFQQGMT